MAHDLKIDNADQLQEELGKYEGKQVIIDFWAAWCGPCKALSPLLDEIEQEEENVVLLKVNVDENSTLSSALGIQSIPTLMFFKDGTANADPIVGAAPRHAIVGRYSTS